MIKLIVADDHNLFREGIKSLLASNPDFNVIADVGDGQALLEILSKDLQPDIVLLDLSMPLIDGFEVLKVSKKKYPNVKFIAISMHADGQYITKCVRSGAYGYLLKNADEEELTDAIHQVYEGKKYYSEDVTALMIQNMSMEGNHLKKLSVRETEILQYISDGKTTKEIAESLYVSTRTVETHRVNMMKKLQVQNTAELIKKAIYLRII